MLDHEYTTKEIFRKISGKDWRQEMTNEKNIITSLSKCDFYPDEPVFQSPVRSLATDEQGRETENQRGEWNYWKNMASV